MDPVPDETIPQIAPVAAVGETGNRVVADFSSEVIEDALPTDEEMLLIDGLDFVYDWNDKLPLGYKNNGLQFKEEIANLKAENARLKVEIERLKQMPTNLVAATAKCMHQHLIHSRCFPVAGHCSQCCCVRRARTGKYKLKDNTHTLPYSAKGQLFRCCHCENIVPFESAHNCGLIGITDPKQQETVRNSNKKVAAEDKKNIE